MSDLPVTCNNPCQIIICQVPQDEQVYSLSGLPPLVPPSPTPLPPPAFFNQQVEIDAVCPFGTFKSAGNTPSWIQVDSANNRIIGKPGFVGGATQALANATALEELQFFYASAAASGGIVCQYPPLPEIRMSIRGSTQYFTGGASIDVNGGIPASHGTSGALVTIATTGATYQFLGAYMTNPAWAVSGYNVSVPITVPGPPGTYIIQIYFSISAPSAGHFSSTLVIQTDSGTCPFFMFGNFT